jgi:hypothetical protein
MVECIAKLTDSGEDILWGNKEVKDERDNGNR